ncbi:hypothetical protein EVAR_24480_1 [Eumeta japonica]|uniref:Uncharacterized protein n=1 Tax=Eumeta variegata TaxID=151549 RepID=A0A4C1WYW8_EUMVA|nr:hypothetical protein EVAR_24480_1 [Eumeta japonica]
MLMSGGRIVIGTKGCIVPHRTRPGETKRHLLEKQPRDIAGDEVASERHFKNNILILTLDISARSGPISAREVLLNHSRHPFSIGSNFKIIQDLLPKGATLRPPDQKDRIFFGLPDKPKLWGSSPSR